MLVLTRKQRQRIVIADNVEMTVLEIRGNRVKIGITAPHDVTIIRAELPLRAQSAVARRISR